MTRKAAAFRRSRPDAAPGGARAAGAAPGPRTQVRAYLVRTDPPPLARPPAVPAKWPIWMGGPESGALILTPKRRLKASDRVRLNWRHPLAGIAAAGLLLVSPLLVVALLSTWLWQVIRRFRG